MAGYKKYMLGLAGWWSLLPTRFLQQLSGVRVIFPFFHAVSDDPLPHIQPLYPVKSIAAFTRDLDFLLRHYEPLDVETFFTLVKNREQPSRPSFLLSFDDGLRQFYDVVAPVLRQKGVPAICFLNSGFVDNQGLFFRYKAALLVQWLTKEPSFRKKAREFFQLSSTDADSDEMKHIELQLLSITYQNRHKLDELAEQTGYRFSDFLATYRPYMSAAQIRELIRQGFYFGAHSIDHPEYRHLPLAGQLRQTKESLDEVCRRFSLSYRAFSFPFTDYGVSKRFFEMLQEQKIADVTFGCAGLRTPGNGTHFQRIPFEVDKLSGRQVLHTELLYHILKKGFFIRSGK